MISLDTIRGYVRSLVGERGIKMLSGEEWRQFTDFGNAIVRVSNDGTEQISRSGAAIDVFEIKRLHGEFNAATARFVDKLTFGTDQNGGRITFTKLFGSVLSAHPMSIYSLCMKFICLWAVEHMVNMKYREKYEGYKPAYTSTVITNYQDLPKN